MPKKATTNHRPTPTQKKRRPTFLSAVPDPGIEQVLAGHRKRRQLYQDVAEELAVAHLLAHFRDSPELRVVIDRCEAEVQIHSVGISDAQDIFDKAVADVAEYFQRA